MNEVLCVVQKVLWLHACAYIVQKVLSGYFFL